MQKTKSKIVLPPKVASKGKIITAWFIDVVAIVALTHFALKLFPDFLPKSSPLQKLGLVGFVFFIFIMVIPNSLLSQSLGGFFLKIKLLNENTYRRVTYKEAFKHSLFLFTSGTEVIEVKTGKHKNTGLDVAFLCFYFVFALTGVGVGLLTTKVEGDLSIAGLLRAFRGEKAVVSKTTDVLPQIKKISGKVMITEKGFPTHEAKLGEELHSGSAIETEEKSSALIIFGKDFLCQFRVAAKSRVNIDEIMSLEAGGSQKNLFNLVKGSVSIGVTQKKSPADINVRTKSAVFGVRGTTFSVETNDTYSSILAVKEGSVEAENLLMPKKIQVTDGKLFVVRKDGREQVLTDPALVEKLNWNLEDDKWEAADVNEAVTAQMPAEETTALPVDSGNLEQEELVKAVTLEIESFKIETRAMTEILTTTTLRLQEHVAQINQESSLITADITCLSAGGACKLNMEKTLIRRGYPTTQGTPRLRQSIIDDLHLYQTEQEKKSDELQAQIDELNSMLAKRQTVLTEAETHLAAKTDLEPSLKKLQDKTLIIR